MTKNPKNTEKMATLGRMTRGLIHDFNNSLASIMGYAEFLITDLDPNSEQHVFAANIKTAGLQMQELIDQIRALSQEKGQGKDLTMHLKENIDTIIGQFRDHTPFHQTIEFDSGQMDAILTMPPHQLRTLISNLLKNGLQSLCGKPGLLMLHMSATPRDHETYAHTALLLEAEGNSSPHIFLDIIDTGCGMDAELLALAPQPLFTTFIGGDAHGMGLPVAYGIMKYLGGGLKILTTPHRGTLIRLTIPVDEIITSPVTMSNTSTQGTGKRILLVEDRDLVRHTLETMMSRDGHTVLSCADGMTALDHLRETPEGFDLLVTDYTMPVITGRDLFNEVRVDFPKLPVILISGDNSSLKEISGQHTADPHIAVLSKPVSPTHLKNLIERMTHARQSQQQNEQDKKSQRIIP